ncbi:ATP-binding protein [Kitasatospora sp. NPDC090091]|uniref:ATP-binding protein n=1 Tax=Kitasatospora sp. NPDC090091 TaxID=3364081 RepID=UPI0038289788
MTLPAISVLARRITLIGTDREHVPPARDAVVRIARSWGIAGEALDDITVVADELLANAVIHAPGRLLVGIHLYPNGDRVVIEVYDPSCRMSAAAANFGNSELTSGRGMLLIESLSENWGAEPTTHGKKVWAELVVPAVAVPERLRSARRTALLASLLRAGRPRPRPHTPAHHGARPHQWFSPSRAPHAHRLRPYRCRHTGRAVTGPVAFPPGGGRPDPTRHSRICPTPTRLYGRMDG